MPVAGEQRGGRQPGDAAADDDDAARQRARAVGRRSRDGRAAGRSCGSPGGTRDGAVAAGEHPQRDARLHRVADPDARRRAARRGSVRAGPRGRRTARARGRRRGGSGGSSGIARPAAAEVGVDVVEQRALLRLGRSPRVDAAGSSVRPSSLGVRGEVAQEVHLLEGRAERAGAGDELGVVAVTGAGSSAAGRRAGTSARRPRRSRRRSRRSSSVVLGRDRGPCASRRRTAR